MADGGEPRMNVLLITCDQWRADALGCAGVARVDFFLTDDGPVLNEVNTMPGFTPISLFPQMWAASGMNYTALVAHLVNDALRRGTGLR